jgi:hypothetical protein
MHCIVVTIVLLLNDKAYMLECRHPELFCRPSLHNSNDLSEYFARLAERNRYSADHNESAEATYALQ